jgi:hypothetical protein
MITVSKATMALSVFLALAMVGGTAQSLMNGSAPRSTREKKPVTQGVVPPIEGGATSVQEGEAVGPWPIEAPAPGVPVDRRTYRELKERAKGGR